MRINTVIPKAKIEHSTDFDFEKFKYCCPVCLLYFNHILISNCCSNYICRFCIGQMTKKAKEHPHYKMRCAHCMKEDIRLSDATESCDLREYTDTPQNLRKKRSKVEI